MGTRKIMRLTVLLAAVSVLLSVRILSGLTEQTVANRSVGAAVASVLILILMSAFVGCAATWRWRGRWTGTLIVLAGIVILLGTQRNLELAPPARGFATLMWLGGIVVPAALIVGHPDGFAARTKRVLQGESALTIISAMWVSMDLHQRAGVKAYRFPDTSRLGLDLHVASALVLLTTLLTVVFHRWRSLTRAEAPFVRPVLVCGSIWAITVIVQRVFLLLPRSIAWKPSGEYFQWSGVFLERGPSLAVQFLVFAFGFVTLIRPRLERIPQGTRILQLDPVPGAEELLQRWTGDPTLRIAFANTDSRTDPASSTGGAAPASTTRWVDGVGRAFVPSTHNERASTTVLDHGRPVALIEHDVSLLAFSATLSNAAVVAGSALDVQRMSAVTQAHLIAASQLTRRLVAAETLAREQLHADLSAGPCADIEAAAQRVIDGEDLTSALHHLRAAVEGVRRIAHGLYPPELVDGGLRAALPLVDGAPASRLPRAIELTACLAVRNDPAARMTVRDGTLHVICTEAPLDPALLDRISVLAGRVTGTTISLPFTIG